MATKFVPLTIDLIEEGSFLHELNEKLEDVQKRLMRYVERHGDEAKGAAAKLSVTLTIKCERPDQDQYSIKTELKSQITERPVAVSIAIGGSSQDGTPALMVRDSGSDEDSPRQGRLFGANSFSSDDDDDDGKIG